MTVAELITRLQTMPRDAKVVVFDEDENDYDAIALLDYKTQVHIVCETPRDPFAHEPD